jgi:uncharacterized protein YdbL (DUF1318 family)
MKKLSMASTLFLTACVTINIYFPAAAAERIADEVIQDIQSLPEIEKKSEPEARTDELKLSLYRWADQILAVIIAPAHAAEANLSIKTAKINQIRSNMKQRFGSLQAFYSMGSIGITANGLLMVRDLRQIALKNRNKVKKLVAAENGDRDRLYRDIANANGHPEWYPKIKSTFARHWVSNARPGWWFQNSSGQWKQR